MTTEPFSHMGDPLCGAREAGPWVGGKTAYPDTHIPVVWRQVRALAALRVPVFPGVRCHPALPVAGGLGFGGLGSAGGAMGWHALRGLFERSSEGCGFA